MLTIIANVVLLAATPHLLFSNSCYAQALNDSSVRGCSSPISTIVNGHQPFNSTGMVRLAPGSAFDEPWYLSLTITDRRDPHYVYGSSLTWQEREGFLSVPNSLAGSQQGNQTEYCMYMLPSRDAGAQQEAGDCSGVLSGECMTALRYNTPSMSDGKCRRPNNLEDACGTVAPLATGSPLNFSSTECTLTGLPHIDLPDNYRTYGYLPVSVTRGGDDRENFDVYDRHVREVVPMVFTIRAPDGAVEHKIVCLAPDNVVEGSRVPESASAHLNSGASLGRALAVVALVLILSIA